MKSLILSMNREFYQKDAAYRISIRYSLVKLLILMMRQSAKLGFSMSTDELVDYVDNFLHKNFRDELSLPQLARRVGLSDSYICKIYRRKTGTTIIARLKQIRLKSAEHELKNTNLSITEICYNSGFNDLSYFYRAFRSQFGIRPGDLLRSPK